MGESETALKLSAGVLMLVVMLFVMMQVIALMGQTTESVTDAIEKMEDGEWATAVAPEGNVNTDKKKNNEVVDTDIVISDSAVSKLLVVVLVVVLGGIAVAAILVWREKVRREQEYTREILSKPLEQFASVEIDNLKEKYDSIG